MKRTCPLIQIGLAQGLKQSMNVIQLILLSTIFMNTLKTIIIDVELKLVGYVKDRWQV